MATETSGNTYTGVHGIVTYAGNPFAYVSAEFTGDREVINVQRGGKWGDLALPGKFSPSLKITYGLVDPDLFVDAFDDGTNITSTSDETLHAAIAGNGALQYITSAITPPSVPMSLKLKIVSTDGFSACDIIITGTDANDASIVESIHFPLVATGSTTTYAYGRTKFKTVTSVQLPAALSANDSLTPYGMGQRNVTLGTPKLVTVVLKIQKSASQYVQLTCTNCWLKSLPLTLGGPSDAELPETEVVIRDPDSDITIQTV